jgi:hypothetical protein
MRALRKGQACLLNLSNDVLGEARIAKRGAVSGHVLLAKR